MSNANTPEPWLRGAVPGIAPVLQPAAHALLQAQEDVSTLAPTLLTELLWRQAAPPPPGSTPCTWLALSIGFSRTREGSH